MRPTLARLIAIFLLIGAAATQTALADEPADGARTLRLHEQWRIDVLDEEQLIGVVSGVLAGPDGSVWFVASRGDGPDVVQMILGSEGTFGIIVSATVRIRRAPASRSNRNAAPALPPVASMGSTSST